MTTPTPELAVLFATTTGVGALMLLSGVRKSLLERRPLRRCPSCGRHLDGHRCRCTP